MAGQRQNTTDYEHPPEPHLLGLHYAMEYDAQGRPIVRTVGGTSTTVNNVTTNASTYDAFGRTKTGEPYTLFDSQHRYTENSKFWTTTTGGGATAHDPNASLVDMTVDTADGSSVMMESTKVFTYQPGKALEINMSFTMNPSQPGLVQRVGYFNDDNGIYLEQDETGVYIVLRSLSTGAVVEEAIAQADWNGDVFDGSGPSTVTLDMTKSQIFYADIEWLGAGSVRVGFIINGQLVIAHQFNHANEDTGTYMTTAALPLRYEIENIAVTGASATLKHICSTVVSNGGFNPSGTTKTVGRGLTYYSMATAGTYYHVVSLQLNSARLDDIVLPSALQVISDSNANFEYRIVKNATFSTPLVFATHADGTVDYSTTDSTVTAQGEVLATGYIANKRDTKTFDIGETLAYQLTRASASDVFSIIITPDTNNSNMAGNISWIEPLRG